MKSSKTRPILAPFLIGFLLVSPTDHGVSGQTDDPVTLNTKADGYRGIWYMNQPSGDEYVYNYSGGLVLARRYHQV